MRLGFVSFVIIALITSGCLSGEESTPIEPQQKTQGVEIDETRPTTAFEEIKTGPAAAPDLNASLDAPPRLVAGEWWRLQFTTPLAEGGATEVVRVIAAVEDDGYLVGMPHEGWYKEAISYHSPAFGDVGFDLSYATHNTIFTPIQWPIVEGNTWTTEFATTPLTATVESVEGPRATIVFTTPPGESGPTDPAMIALGLAPPTGEFMRLTYDATIHEVVHFGSGIGEYKVIEHGYDFEGWITIPRGEHTAIDYGQFGPATPGEPLVTRTLEIDGGYNRMTLMHAVFPIAGPGVYRIRTLAPDGTEFMTESTNDLKIQFFEITNPDGTWTAEDLVAGAGVTYSMGIAYHQYDIRLPDGARRSDHSHPVIR